MQNGKQCPCCGKKLADSAFYKSLNPKHKDKLTPMCKKCCVKQSLDDIGDNVDIERFKNTLYFNDKPYRAELHRACIAQAEKRYSDEGGKTKAETVVGLYFGKLSSLHQYKNMTWDDSNSLADDQADHAYDATSDALDNMFDSYQREKQKEIEVLENSISSEEKLYSAAIKRISENWNTLYSDLTDWVYNYGNITQNTLDEAWNNASLAVQKYGSYLEAVLQTQQQLAALEASSSSSSSTVIGGGVGTTGTPNVIGNTGNYDTSGKDTFAQANTIVEQMKQNSANWHGGDKTALHNDNRNLAKQLETLLGWPIDFDEKSGTWYMRGKKLYDQFPIYHSGGIVGDDPTLEQDELFAKLKKGEAVLTEKQQEVVDKALDVSGFVPVSPEETMLGRYGALFGAMQSTDLVGAKMQAQIQKDTQQAHAVVSHGGDSFDINVPVQIYPAQKLDEKEIKGLTDKISKYTIAELDDVFALRGKRSLRR